MFIYELNQPLFNDSKDLVTDSVEPNERHINERESKALGDDTVLKLHSRPGNKLIDVFHSCGL